MLEAAILNLHAQAVLTLGKLDESEEMAKRAEDAADKQKQAVELANAYRLQGVILLRRNSAVQAVPRLELALSEDKRLGLAVKIAEDLHWLAEAKEMLGQHAEAEVFRGREHTVRSALGDDGQ